VSTLAKENAATNRTELQAKDIINNIQLGLYIYHLEDIDDREGRTLRLVSANQATAEMTGVPVGDVMGKTIDENFPGLREKGLPQIFAEVVRSGQPQILPDVHYSDDRIVQSVYATKLFPLPNQHVGVSFENITERKLAEAQKRKDQELFRDVSTLAHIGSWEVDIETMATAFTEEVFKLYEIPIGTPPAVEEGILYYAPEARPIITAAVERAIGEGIPYDLELPFITAKGNARWVRTVGKADFVDGKATRLYGVIQDITERKQAEIVVRESEADYRALFENMNNGFALHKMVFDDQGKPVDFIFLTVNELFEEHTTLKREDIIGKRVTEILPGIENAKPDWIGLYGQLVTSGENFSFEHYTQATQRWSTVTAYRPKEGHFAVVFTDITERKRAEDALRESETRLHSIIATVPDIIYRLDPSGKITFISSTVQEYGYLPEDLAGQHIVELAHPAMRENAQFGLCERRTGDRRTQSFEVRLLTKEQFLAPADIDSVSLDEAPMFLVEAEGLYARVEGEAAQFLGTQGIARDITERKKLEEARALSLSLRRVRHEISQMEGEEYWLDVVQALDEELRRWIPYSACGINLIDFAENTRMTYGIANGEGVRQREVKHIGPVFHCALKEKKTIYRPTRIEIEKWQSKAAEHVNSVVDVPFTGGTLAVNSTKENAFDERHIRILEQFSVVVGDGVVRLGDLIKVAEQEKQLRQIQKMEAVGQLTAGLAHNFNNLLQPIMMGLQLGKMEASEQMRPFLEDSYIAAERARDMIKQMMALSRQSSSGKSALLPVQLSDILAETIDLCQKTMDRRIEVRTHFNKDTPRVLGEANQLEQVFLNLLLNARDAVQSVEWPAIIDVALDVLKVDGAVGDFVGKRSGDYVCVEVSDNGIGMDSKTQSRVFEPFFTTKEVGQGTGLGLAMAFGIIQQHEGWIQCRSEIGSGTTFAVYFPVTTEVETASLPVDAQGLARGNETILAVEDEDSIREVIRFIFERQGYEVITAEDGQQGLELFKRDQGRIDLVLLDLSLPRLSGQEVLAQIRGLVPSMRVLIMTGLRVDVADCKGALGLVEKPFEVEDLLQMVRSALDGDLQIMPSR
jgi:PAS domain S-box-containing protein